MSSLTRVAKSYGVRNRARKLGFAQEFVRQHDIRSILFVGVSAGNDAYNNIIEVALQHQVDRAVATGLGAEAEADSPWREYQYADALDLPFEDQSFDLVYSNAVLEHVGDETAQQKFVDEHARVGRHWILTTPNRLFPVEAHRHVLFVHWARSWKDPYGSVTRLVSKADLRRLIPTEARIRGTGAGPTLTAYR